MIAKSMNFKPLEGAEAAPRPSARAAQNACPWSVKGILLVVLLGEGCARSASDLTGYLSQAWAKANYRTVYGCLNDLVSTGLAVEEEAGDGHGQSRYVFSLTAEGEAVARRTRDKLTRLVYTGVDPDDLADRAAKEA